VPVLGRELGSNNCRAEVVPVFKHFQQFLSLHGPKRLETEVTIPLEKSAGVWMIETEAPPKEPISLHATVLTSDGSSIRGEIQSLKEGALTLKDFYGAVHKIPSNLLSGIYMKNGRVVYLSFVTAGPAASFVHARSHGATEAMLRDSGLRWGAVRNGMYGDEIASWFFDVKGHIFKTIANSSYIFFTYGLCQQIVVKTHRQTSVSFHFG
jgi:hypothetical protein